MNFNTRIVHTGTETDPSTGASAVPIYQVSTYAQRHPVELGEYEYGRGDNPTRHAVEKSIAILEGAEAGFAFASGMAAISSVLLNRSMKFPTGRRRAAAVRATLPVTTREAEQVGLIYGAMPASREEWRVAVALWTLGLMFE